MSVNGHGSPTPESFVASSGRIEEKVSLSTLQSKMKCDPEGYVSELMSLYRHFDSSLDQFFQKQASIGEDPSVAKELGDLAGFLSYVTPLYPTHLSDFPQKIADLLRSSAKSLPSYLRFQLVQALIPLINRKFVDMGDILALFMDLQSLGEKKLKKLAFDHVVFSIKRMNHKHNNEEEDKKRTFQNILFSMLQGNDESKAKSSLTVLCNLHKRRVWFDDRTANAICAACFHSSSRIMIAALSFLLGYDRLDEADNSDASSNEDKMTPQKADVVLNREAVYKAVHKGTIASKKKKKAKLQRSIRSMKRQQRAASEKTIPNHYSPLDHLNDAQVFAETLFSCLQTCDEQFEVKMMMIKVIARTVGLHRLILLNFYPFLQKYVKPHQLFISELLAAAVQACHDMVPPEAVEPLFRQVVNQFVHDRSCTEAVAVGLNVVREICLRLPLLMTEELLQEIVLYEKSHEDAISTAARSLITLFRDFCPSLMVNKDCGRPINPKAQPKAFKEVDCSSIVSDLELLGHEDDDNNEFAFSISGNEGEEAITDEQQIHLSDDDDGGHTDDKEKEESDGVNDDDELTDDDGGGHTDDEEKEESDGDGDGDDDDVDDEDEENDEGEDEDENEETNEDEEQELKKTKSKKRKFIDFNGQLNAADTSLKALKRLGGSKKECESSELTDGILSNEDFKRIKELKAKKDAKIALAQHGLLRKGSEGKSKAFKIPSADQLSAKRVDPSQLEVHIRKKMTKEERLALVRAGREDRVKYQSSRACKQKKQEKGPGGLSNRQKEHKKLMPLAAKKAKISRSRQEKKVKKQRSGKQFRGKKAWK